MSDPTTASALSSSPAATPGASSSQLAKAAPSALQSPQGNTTIADGVVQKIAGSPTCGSTTST
ncbi:hypothetical protein [Georgenia wutianyii]|uniref:hypothetical protein n=1 Tax=Georgenia wutianyii TaxID=2585135 RepID=UPI0015D30622|nr:hypothetical protein [Georgenia wutianyii]